MNILNKAKVDALYQRETVLLGTRDAVPAYRVAALFGQDAADFARRVGEPGQNANGYGVGDYTLWYFTYCGFLTAASFCNVRQLRELASRYEVAT